MNIRPTIIRGLLRVYPAAWRAEYGEELGALLSDRPVNPSIVVDVVISATREHMKRDPIWKTCGICLFAWTVIGILLNNTVPLSHGGYEFYKTLWQLGLLLAGCLTLLGNRGKSPTWAALKAALLGSFPEMVALILWAAGIFHPLVTRAAGPYPLVESRLALFYITFPTVPPATFGVLPLYIGVILAQACVFGFLGGLLGRVIRFFSPPIQRY
jgi:hypothetical protein